MVSLNLPRRGLFGSGCRHSSARNYVCENAGTEMLRFVKNVVC